MFSPVEEIRTRLDIVDVVGFYVKLKKAGANYKALCPFHSEKTPSFFVSPAKQIWKCFGCGRGGDMFDFVKEIEGVEFADALKILAERAGVELKPIKKEILTQRQRLYDICELATRFFEAHLQKSRKGKKAKEYLFKRTISEQSIEKWRLGWAPESWHGLLDFLVSKGYQPQEIERAGLIIKNEKGRYYDRFRGRIMFPIFDLNSRVVGFGGRVFGLEKKEGLAKYINTPNTLIYDKGRILYGLHQARPSIRQNNFCILVEGYVDVILSSQVGIQNIVASSGTALTSYQLKILKRYSENLYLAFDMDIAGDFATKRGIDLAQQQGFNIKVILMPEKKDPADIISQDSSDWRTCIEKAKSILEFYFENAFSRFDKTTVEGKREISKILLPVLKRIPNKIVQSHWIQKLSEELGVKEGDIIAEMKKIEMTIPEEKEEEKLVLVHKSRKELLEERIIKLILKLPRLKEMIEDSHLALFSEQNKNLISLLKNKDFAKIQDIEPFLDERTAKKIQLLSFEAEIEEKDKKESDLEQEMIKCLKEVKIIIIKEKLKKISQEIKKAEQEKDERRVDSLTEQFNQLIKELNQ